jgi:hypothetical protein
LPGFDGRDVNKNSGKHFFFGGGQGCQMVYFHSRKPNLGKFWRVLKMLVYFMNICNILQPFGRYIYGRLVLFVFIRFIFFPHFGMFGPRKIWQPWMRAEKARKEFATSFHDQF